MKIVIDTWNGFLSNFDNIHLYLDDLESRDKKLRLAVDTETCLCKRARDLYDLEYSLKKQKPKDKKEGKPVEIVRCPKYPVPKPIKNKWGFYDLRVRLLQIGLDPKECNVQYVFDLYKIFLDFKKFWPDLFTNFFIFEDTLKWYGFIGPIIKKLLDRVSILGQNLKYEYGIFWHDAFFNFRLGELRDLFIMSQVLYMGDKINHKLSYLYEKNLDEEFFKQNNKGKKTFKEYHKFKEEEQLSPWWDLDLAEDQLEYASEDVGPLVWAVFDKLYADLVEWDLLHCSGEPGKGVLETVKKECELIKVISKEEIRGLAIDHEYYFREVKPFLQRKADEALNALRDQFPERVYTVKKKKKKTTGKGADKVIEIIEYEETKIGQYNPRSWQQIRELLHMPSKADLATTSEDDLRPLIKDYPWVKWIIQNKKAQSFITKFEGDGGYITLSMRPDSLAHQSIFQIGQDEETIDTGRLSATKFNGKQVPAQDFLFKEIMADKLVRRAFIPRKNCKMWVYDFSQIEPRIQADWCQDLFLISCFRDGKDMHSITAQKAFKLDYEPDKNDKTDTYRKKGKICRLGTTYGMGLDKFIKWVFDTSEGDIDYYLRGDEGRTEAQAFLDALKELHPETEDMKKEIERQVKFLPYKYQTLWNFREGTPFYVGTTLAWERTRRCGLSPEERTFATRSPQEWGADIKALNPRTGKWSTFVNKFNRKLSDAARICFNNVIQGTAADIQKESMIEIDKKFEVWHDLGFIDEHIHGIINDVHDELMGQGPDDWRADLMGWVVKSTMEEVGSKYIQSVPILVEGKTGYSWHGCK